MIIGYATKDSVPIEGTDFHMVEVALYLSTTAFMVVNDKALLQGAYLEETQTIDPDVEAPTGIGKKEHEEKPKETFEEIKKRARKPPSEGKCRVCGQDRPLNRSKICYRCFVIENLKKDGWKEGEPHPDSCGCEGLAEHKNGNGSSRGNN